VTIELSAPGARALFEPPFGGRLHQLFIEIDGHEQRLLAAPDDASDYAREPLIGGMYPMAPWPNRVRDGRFSWAGSEVTSSNGREHALHGLVLDQPWKVVARVGRILEMSTELPSSWPWRGSIWQRFQLGPGSLAMKMEVRSSAAPFPAACGWHPWFRRDFAGAADARLTLPAACRYVLEGNLPTGERLPPVEDFALDGRPLGDRRLDDCYIGLEGPAVLQWPRLRLGIAADSPNPHVQVYTTPEAVCVEPQTCAPDAFNLPPLAGVAMAAPGRAVSLACRWTWEVLP
jgi:aldose 1-epimerase